MRVAAVVLSVDEAALLEDCLPALRAADEVLVIDNACGDATRAVAERCGARVLALTERQSYAAAVNAGFAAVADADAVLLVNADCVIEAGAVAALAGALEADPGLGSAAPKLLGRDGARVDAAGITVDRRRKNLLVGHGAPASAYAVAGPAFGGDGAAVLWRRAALDDCAVAGELLDEDMGLWATESDLAWRAQLRGWRCAYVPAAVGHHVARTYSPSTPRRQIAASHRRLQFRNRLLMLLKNETRAGLLHDLPRIAAYELTALAFALLLDRPLLPAYADVWRARHSIRRRRRAIQARVVSERPPFGLTPSGGVRVGQGCLRRPAASS